MTIGEDAVDRAGSAPRWSQEFVADESDRHLTAGAA